MGRRSATRQEASHHLAASKSCSRDCCRSGPAGPDKATCTRAVCCLNHGALSAPLGRTTMVLWVFKVDVASTFMGDCSIDVSSLRVVKFVVKEDGWMLDTATRTQ
eukprot:GHVU01197245.1.p4 GENE.GHVU01197245.1~~GHVU01197245.1.p4  ORF type:complete len:105 (-),score=7.52 GHVU01197245.1:1541-1855(-)